MIVQCPGSVTSVGLETCQDIRLSTSYWITFYIVTQHNRTLEFSRQSLICFILNYILYPNTTQSHTWVVQTITCLLHTELHFISLHNTITHLRCPDNHFSSSYRITFYILTQHNRTLEVSRQSLIFFILNYILYPNTTQSHTWVVQTITYLLHTELHFIF